MRRINSKFIIEHVTPVFTSTIGIVLGFFFGARQDVCFPEYKIWILFSPLFVMCIFAILFDFSELKIKIEEFKIKQAAAK